MGKLEPGAEYGEWLDGKKEGQEGEFTAKGGIFLFSHRYYRGGGRFDLYTKPPSSRRLPPFGPGKKSVATAHCVYILMAVQTRTKLGAT